MPPSRSCQEPRARVLRAERRATRRLWEVGAEDARLDDFLQYRELIGQLAAAARQVNDVGTQAQREEAKQVLTRARQSLYKLLAADAVEDAAEPADPA